VLLGILVFPMGGPTTYQVEYGLTEAYGQSTPPSDAGAGSSAEGMVAELTGLTPDTTYHYRVSATNGGGTTHSTDETFTTHATPGAETEPPPGFSLTGTAPAGPGAVVFASLTGVAPTPAAPTKTTTKPPALTRAQRLAKALRACAKRPRKRRASCKRRARKAYGATRSHRAT
jgi:hypothetical protein